MSRLSPPPLPAEPVAVVADDTLCLECAYNLRTLSFEGRCPECGTPVGISAHGNFLRYCDPAWMEKLALGITLIVWGVVGILIGTVLVALLAARYPMPASIIGFLAGLAGFAGAWLFTSPDPSGIGDMQYKTPRTITRVCLAIGVGASLLRLLSDYAGATPSAQAPKMGLLSIALSLVHVVGVLAELRYFEKLARRVPDPDLAKLANTVMWAYGLSMAFMVVVSGLLVLVGVRELELSHIIPIIVLARVPLLISGVMYLVLLSRMNNVIQQQAVLALRTWNSATPTSTAAPGTGL